MQMLKYVNDGYEYSCHFNPLKSELITKQADWDEIVVSLFFSYLNKYHALLLHIKNCTMEKSNTDFTYINNICKKESLTGQK